MKILIAILLLPLFGNSQTLVSDTLYFDNGAKVVVKRNATTTTTPTTSRLNDTASALRTAINSKQATLVSNTNIKTVNGTSLLGSGDITTDNDLLAYAALGSPILCQTVNQRLEYSNVSTALVDGQIKYEAIYLPKAAPFSSTYAASAGIYFAAFIYNNSAQTTAPTLASGVALNNLAMSSTAMGFTNSAKLHGTSNGTDLPSSIAMSSITASVIPSWVGGY
jgi:hypothetical protein